MHASPVRPTTSSPPRAGPPGLGRRAHLPALLLWLLSIAAAVTAPAWLGPALAAGPGAPVAGPTAFAAGPAVAPAGIGASVAGPAAAAGGGVLPGANAMGSAGGFAGGAVGPPGPPSGSRPAAAQRVPGVGAAVTAQRVPALLRPVDGPLVRGFEEAAGPFGPGHRGVDFGAGPGAPVRAPASGRVTFAGPVAGTTWVTLEVAPAVLVTLGPLRTLQVSAGQAVAAGDRLGTVASGHASSDPSVAALHLGLRVEGTYVDPLPWLVGLARPRLVPLAEPGGPH